jgi:hypothetical protein
VADRPAYPDTRNESDDALDGGSDAGTPRWVKISALVVLVVVVVFVILLLAGGHDPNAGRH